jgi:hypothetical protein
MPIKLIAATAAAMLAVTLPAQAQSFARQPVPAAMPPLKTVVGKPAANVRAVKLTPAQKTVAVRQLTGNQAANATGTTLEFSPLMGGGDAQGAITFYDADAVSTNVIWAMMQKGGMIVLELPGLGGATMNGIWLFDCSVGANSLSWRASPKGYAGGDIGAKVPVSSTSAVFAVDFRTLSSARIVLSADDSDAWVFARCSATLVQ